MDKYKAIQSHLAQPAINGPNGIVAGNPGQTHADLASGDNPHDGGVDESRRGFITHDGRFINRQQAHDELTLKGVDLGDYMPDSRDLIPIEPIYRGRSGQEIYHFPNGLGASVVDEGSNFKELAVIRLHDPKIGPGGGFHLDYRTPIGPPRSGLTPDEVRHLLEDIYRLTPDDLRKHMKMLDGDTTND